MGRGDKRSAKGKRSVGSYGKTRLKGSSKARAKKKKVLAAKAAKASSEEG